MILVDGDFEGKHRENAKRILSLTDIGVGIQKSLWTNYDDTALFVSLIAYNTVLMP